jgi:hypothetical protein
MFTGLLVQSIQEERDVSSAYRKIAAEIYRAASRDAKSASFTREESLATFGIDNPRAIARLRELEWTEKNFAGIVVGGTLEGIPQATCVQQRLDACPSPPTREQIMDAIRACMPATS